MRLGIQKLVERSLLIFGAAYLAHHRERVVWLFRVCHILRSVPQISITVRKSGQTALQISVMESLSIWGQTQQVRPSKKWHRQRVPTLPLLQIVTVLQGRKYGSRWYIKPNY